MSAISQEIITSARVPRTGPAIFRGSRGGYGGVRPAQSVGWTVGDTTDSGLTFRVAVERLCEAVALESHERMLTVSAANRATTLARPERLPFRSSAFDVVLTSFASMFLPNHLRSASELLRVCRPGGRIGLACWTPDGFNGELIGRIERYVGGASDWPVPAAWGTREYLNDLFGHAADALGAADRTHTWRYDSPRQWLDEWRADDGPLAPVFWAVDPEWRDQLAADLLDLVDRHNEADDGSMVVSSAYLEFIVHKRARRA